jgi:hypothetical protein
MAMQKYADGEGRLETLKGREANVLHDFQTRLGIYKVSDFSDTDREQLMVALDEARKLDEEENNERQEARAARQQKKKEKELSEDARESSVKEG